MEDNTQNIEASDSFMEDIQRAYVRARQEGMPFWTYEDDTEAVGYLLSAYAAQAAELATTRATLSTLEGEKAEAVNALRSYQDQIRGWGIYRHYKGGRYKVLASAMNEANGETMVLYMDLASRQQYTRPEKEFFEEVAPGTPRFAIELPSDCATCTTPGECKKGGQGNG